MVTSLDQTAPLVAAAETAESAPWWGVPVIAGGFLILGAVLGYVFNRLQDDRRARRERTERWDQTLLDHTARVMSFTRDFLQWSFDHNTAIEAFTEVAVQQMKAGEPVGPPPVGGGASSQALFDAFDALRTETSTLQLAAPAKVREAATLLQEQARAIYFSDQSEPDKEKTEALLKALGRLEQSVRDHFGIK